MTQDLTIYHIPGCPFSERIEIMMALKGVALKDVEIDISKPRPDWLLAKSGGTTALPLLDVENGESLKESMVILRYLEQRYPQPAVAHPDPFHHAVEGMLAELSGPFSGAGYRMILNRDADKREEMRAAVDAEFGKVDAFLRRYATGADFLFEDRFGWAEVAFTPMFKRLWFLEYYEDYAVPAQFDRALRWRAACVAHPAAQHRSHEELIKLYYDYSQGGGNGRIPEGRAVSSLSPDFDWRKRPMPPRDKWGRPATDKELGLAA
ncbi:MULTISPECIES: glutathione S-transferase family protein [unclassified Sphingobium]|uniref:glutathione S-transferase family protein n=1 Tax=unclassified Sphingobium TaxID=2611147 RepID=UPI00222410CB|nr:MULTISPECIES: glutathione S-transferase family protein [unclassified Sphingobium]MCW2393974.1 glutathione S-transferase [Sphingobium sp. B8D3B]MCW2417488.1 glutathione S-transferase [Sphingobium sp. B8D3C]